MRDMILKIIRFLDYVDVFSEFIREVAEISIILIDQLEASPQNKKRTE